jgi:two-component system cell cycle sensor histidine kinase/response regulator CckA
LIDGRLDSATEWQAMRILVVEDDPAVRPFLDVLLTIKGFNTLTAANAAEADALLLDFPAPPQLAVLDIVLPGVGGLAYADTLLVRYPGIRVIFITGWEERVPADEAHKRGQLLYKPFAPQDLLDAIGLPSGRT